MADFQSTYPKYSASQEHREEAFTPTREVAEEPLFRVLVQLGDAATALSVMWAMYKGENGLGTKELPSAWAQTSKDSCALRALSRATSVTPPKASL